MTPAAKAAGSSEAVHSSSMSTAAVLAFALGVGALYLGREIFLPFALAILLSFMLAPLVTFLRRYHLPRVPAIIATVLITFIAFSGLLAVVGGQVVTFADNLPGYQHTIRDKIRALKSSAPGGGIFERALVVFHTLGREISVVDEPTPAAQPDTEQPAPRTPVPVRIEQPSQPFTIIQHLLGGLVGPIGTLAIVIVLVIFILLEREDLRDRFIRLAGRDVHRTTQALNEAARRVSRYLLMQLAVNAIYGSLLGVGLFAIGIPNPVLWAVLATLLRFIPYLGPFIAAFFPIALAFAVDPGWSKLLWTLALILTMELISNNFIEPRFYGSSTGLSSIAIIISAIFWTVLWGPVGLVLATPLTVCLVVIGRYVPQLEFLGLLLGSEPPLAPEEKFYQRLVAGNAEEALEIAEAYTADKPILQFYEEQCLPALRLAEIDRQQGKLGVDSGKTVSDVALTVVRELGETSSTGDAATKDSGNNPRPPGWEASPVLCIAGRGEHDGVVSAMLVQLLEQRGIAARSAPASSLVPDAISKLELAGVEVLALSFLHPTPQPYARYACRRLRRRAPHVKLVVGCWNLPPTSEPLEAVAEAMGADAIEVSISGAIARIERFECGKIGAEMMAPSIPANEAARLDALHRSGLLESRSGGHLDRIARRIAEAFETPIALVTLVDESCQLWKGAVGLPDDLNACRQAPRETSICGHVVADNKTLVIEDTARDPRFANNPFLQEHNIRFYAGAPLRAAQGCVIGSLCVIDTRPRKLTSRDVKFLEMVADELMSDVARREGDSQDADRGALASVA
jgi:predicted PurR-regulated permease PerM